ncbi:uncharacterized protein LOC130823534 [Amaranthus tricolor]|uniref:uncharacterized protein LOC130823534 n=1 Tax=Amaranthus tricolor TaxID=29722 RepID=UPI002585B2D4|nr:uncharacterized protein LOC130823534 [Amaranthus tricolor]
MEVEDIDGMIGHPPSTRGHHINKRALRNKSLSISFNEKDLRDYVGGFHKRKKKRRKEALKQQEEAKRRKRLEDRKRRRKEKEYALYGGASPPENDAELDDEDVEQGDTMELNPSISGTTSYDNGDMTVTVTTKIIAREEEEYPIQKAAAPLSAASTEEPGKKIKIPVSSKKSFKKASKGRSRPKLNSKRDRRKGKNNANKRRH